MFTTLLYDETGVIFCAIESERPTIQAENALTLIGQHSDLLTLRYDKDAEAIEGAAIDLSTQRFNVPAVFTVIEGGKTDPLDLQAGAVRAETNSTH